jgi:hypothetical protein
METLFCPNCKIEEEYYTELKSNQNTARCMTCNTFIKNIPYEDPKFYVGKYKGQKVADIEDMGYLKWALKEMRLSASTRKAIEARIAQFEHLAR